MKKVSLIASLTLFLGVIVFLAAKHFLVEPETNVNLTHEQLGDISLNDRIGDFDNSLLEELPVDHIKYQKMYVYDDIIELGVNEEGYIKSVLISMDQKNDVHSLDYAKMRTNLNVGIGDEPAEVLKKYKEDPLTGREMGMGDYYRYKGKKSELTFWYKSQKEGIYSIVLEEL